MTTVLRCLALFSLSYSVGASAVMLDPGNEGQVLIFPYIGALGGNATLVSINSQEVATPRALKVLFRNRSGEIALSFNLYLEGRGSWVAAVSQTDGQTTLNIPDGSCTVPDLTASGPSYPLTMNSGWMEVLEMGAIADDSILDAVNDQRCDEIEALWSENGAWDVDPQFGIAPPVGRLRGSSSLIDVNQASMHSIPATALSQFSDIPQHTSPSETIPNLTSAHDAGTSAGETKSIVCGKGRCVEDAWDRPLDAVAAALMALEMQGEYSTAPSITATTEVIVNYPLRTYYASENDINQANPRLLLELRGREGETEETGGGGFGCAPLISSPCRGTWQQSADQVSSAQSVNILRFGDSANEAGSEKVSDILHENYTAFFPDSEVDFLPESGAFWIGFEIQLPEALRSNSGNLYVGVPVVAVVFERFTNGYVIDQEGRRVLANYGNAFQLSRKPSVVD